MKVVITGSNGQLGHVLVNLLSPDHQVFSFNRQEMDITNFLQIVETVQRIKPDAIIHAAAYTQVDRAEADQDSAYYVNAYGTRNVAVAAQQSGSTMIYISTDYVFDGESSTPYKEFDSPNPLSVYGKSKLAGEEMVRNFCDKYFIVRTSWLYGKHGHNFVKKMLTMAHHRKELSVVHDQIGSPTYTFDLAYFLKELLQTNLYGIYHASNTGSCSWYELSKAVFKEAGLDIKVNPVETKDFPRPAPRPAYSVLDHMAIRLNGLSDFRDWRQALKEFVGELK